MLPTHCYQDFVTDAESVIAVIALNNIIFKLRASFYGFLFLNRNNCAYIIHAGAIRQNKMIRNYRNGHRSEQCNCFHDWRGGAQLLD